MLEFLLDKKSMLESLPYDQLTDEDIIFYKDVIYLLNELGYKED